MKTLLILSVLLTAASAHADPQPLKKLGEDAAAKLGFTSNDCSFMYDVAADILDVGCKTRDTDSSGVTRECSGEALIRGSDHALLKEAKLRSPMSYQAGGPLPGAAMTRWSQDKSCSLWGGNNGGGGDSGDGNNWNG